jgi:hypothetical protein
MKSKCQVKEACLNGRTLMKSRCHLKEAGVNRRTPRKSGCHLRGNHEWEDTDEEWLPLERSKHE